MYAVDEHDKVVEITDVPQSCVGAPCPMILAGEGILHLVYYLQEFWTGAEDEVRPEDRCALVKFRGVHSLMFGPPNDEAFDGHPLADRGLEPYSVFEVQNSSWIRTLERMNSVHEYHRPELFKSDRHFIFSFHDEVFECVADDFEVEVHQGHVQSVLRASWDAL